MGMKRCRVDIGKLINKKETSRGIPREISSPKSILNTFDDTWNDDLEELELGNGPAIFHEVNDAIYKDDSEEDVPLIEAIDITNEVNMGVEFLIPACLGRFTMEQGGQDTKDKSSANKLDWEFGIFPDSLHKESMTDIYPNENVVNSDEDPLFLQQEFVQVLLPSSE